MATICTNNTRRPVVAPEPVKKVRCLVEPSTCGWLQRLTLGCLSVVVTMASHEHHHDDEEHNNLNSPSQIAMTGHDFSPEDIQDLLGGVLSEDDPHPPGYHHHQDHAEAPEPRTALSNSSNNTNEESDDTTTGTSSTTALQQQARALARTERKRKLEKQRRSDVNKQFTELSALLRVIETEAPDQVQGLPAYSPANRVDLIARTVSLLKKLHTSHKKLKVDHQDLEEQLENAKKAGEETAAKLKESIMAPHAMGNNRVMMMVPMLIGSDNTSNGPAGGPPAAVPMMQPWMPSPFAMPQSSSQPANTAAGSSSSSSAAGAMPWMMPQTAMPWMMQPHHMANMMSAMPSPPSASGVSTDKGTDSPNSNKKVAGNLAHCA